MSLAERYEKVRQLCLTYAGLHPHGKGTCYEALRSAQAPLIDGMTIALAELCDDQATVLDRLINPTGHAKGRRPLRDVLAMNAPITLADIPETRNWQQIGVGSAVCERVPLEERLAELGRRRYAYADAMLAAREES